MAGVVVDREKIKKIELYKYIYIHPISIQVVFALLLNDLYFAPGIPINKLMKNNDFYYTVVCFPISFVNRPGDLRSGKHIPELNDFANSLTFSSNAFKSA